MSWNTRRNQIVAAVDSTVQVFNMRDPGKCFKIYVVLSFQGLSGPGSSPGGGLCVAFLGKTLHSIRATET